MAGLVTDTHALIWYLSASPRISRIAFERMEATLARGDSLFVPSICLVEILYLVEKSRIPYAAWERLSDYLDRLDSGMKVAALDRAVAAAISRIPREQVPDMPDRIIAATALHLNLPLVTRDRKIRTSEVESVW
jgi:PIN domain nuclease of toxin-antitoxin system